MNAETHLQSGDLGPALKELMDQVKSNPSDSKLRIFLFQLFAVQGQWKRAQTQLEMAGDMDPKAELMVKAYTEAVRICKYSTASTRT